MAAQSKTTAVHFSLIIFVMLSVILGVVALLFFNDYRNQEAQFQQNKDALRDAETAVRQRGDEIAALKNVIGIDAAEIGPDGAEGTVIGQANQTIQTLGSNPSSTSFVVALKDLRTEVNNLTTQLAERDATISGLQAELKSLHNSYKTVSNEHDLKRQASEADLASVQESVDEKAAVKDQEIAELRELVATAQTELERTEGQLGTQLAKAQQQISNLLNIQRSLREKLDRAEGESFEVADGGIVKVDQVGRVVWINIGKDEGLKPGITFSVYAKRNAGIGREGSAGGSAEDIKAHIEVVEIMGENMAEARILDETGTMPIVPGDLIYTPLWGAGRSEAFAFAGAIDIDGDGDYAGDRERLHEIVQSSGSEISAELLVTGERVGGNIDENTRFLVVGNIPPVEEAAAGTQEQQQYELLAQEYSKMKTEAEVHGVRVIGLNSFLDFIGFVPQQNRFVPGKSQNWTLDAGAPERANRSSSGNTSALFDTSRSRPNPSSETSQTFEGEE